MKNSIFFLMVLGLFASCDNDEAPVQFNDGFQIESYHAAFAHFPVTINPNPDGDNLIKFVYDGQGRISRKIGDVFYLSPSAGTGNGYISDSLFTDIEYFGNQARVTKQTSASSFTILPNESIVTFDMRGRMIQKARAYEPLGGGLLTHDTINYEYSNNKLTGFSKIRHLDVEDATFDIEFSEVSSLYYSNGNLDSIVTVYSRVYSDMPYVVLEKKETQSFGGYDTSENPFRNLQLFDETFTRSLSANNYTETGFKKVEYYYPDWDYTQQPSEYVTTTNFQYWPYTYDNNGHWIYTVL